MARRKAKTEDEKTIPEIADEVSRKTVRGMHKGGKLTPQGRRIAKLMDRIMPPEKVDEWGWDLSRKRRAEIKRRAADEARRAEARARAAYRRRLKALENDGEIDGHIQMKWAFMETFRELKRRGFSALLHF